MDVDDEELVKNMKIHYVKHLPKTDEEMLDKMIKENSKLSMKTRKVRKDAQAKLEQRKA